MPIRKPPIANSLWIAFATFVSLGFAVTVVGFIRTSQGRGAHGPKQPRSHRLAACCLR